MTNDPIEQVIDIEWQMFQQVNEGGPRASCQNDQEGFYALRRAQFEAWSSKAVRSYLGDLRDAMLEGRNLVRDKYVNMMRVTDRSYLEAHGDVPEGPGGVQGELVDKLVALLSAQFSECARHYPHLAAYARPATPGLDARAGETSYETYLRGELETYSLPTLRALDAHIDDLAGKGLSYVDLTVANTVRARGFSSLEEAEATAARLTQAGPSEGAAAGSGTGTAPGVSGAEALRLGFEKTAARAGLTAEVGHECPCEVASSALASRVLGGAKAPVTPLPQARVQALGAPEPATVSDIAGQDGFFAKLDAAYRTGDRMLVERYLKQACARADGGDVPLGARASVHNELATLYRSTSRLREAIHEFEVAMWCLRRAGEADSRAYATLLMNRAGALRLAGDGNSALAQLDEAMDLLCSLGLRESYEYASALNYASMTHQDMGDLVGARELAEEALRSIVRIPDSEAEQATSHGNLAAIDLQIGDVSAVQAEAARAIEAYERLGDLGVHYASALSTLGVSLDLLGMHEEAVGVLERALAKVEASVGKNLDYAAICDNLSRACLSAGDFPASERYGREHDRIMRELRGGR